MPIVQISDLREGHSACYLGLSKKSSFPNFFGSFKFFLVIVITDMQ